MRGLLVLLREHEQAVEADLARYYRIDYRDRWRFDEDGNRKLTLRMIKVRLKYLPPQSALGQVLDLDTGWTVGDYLLADVFHALTKKRHPARPKTRSKPAGKGRSRQRAERLAAAKRRKAARDARIARGEL